MTPQHPDGIGERSFAIGQDERFGGVFALVLLGLLLVAAMTGRLGGAPHPSHEARSALVTLQIDYPAIIRSGEFFEARITMTPHENVRDLTLSVSPSLWREHTVNSIVPAPADETFEGGAYRFSFGPAKAGEPFFVKIAFQLNPPLFGGTSGEIGVQDGETPLASLPLSLKVMP